jgi:BsuBI/PstI restriction endonuclease domain
MPIEFVPKSHTPIQKAIITAFLPKFARDCKLLYVNDENTNDLNESLLTDLNITKADIGLLPAVVGYDSKKGWLYLFETESCMTESRVSQLKHLLAACKAELIFISAFLTKQDYIESIEHIAWESEVWLADNPDHMIHFNGNKFLGPYKKTKTRVL